MRRIRIALAALALSALLVAPLWVRARRSDPQAVLRALAAALNAGDVEGALTLFTGDAAGPRQQAESSLGRRRSVRSFRKMWPTISNGSLSRTKR